jgi:hypothetical protein
LAIPLQRSRLFSRRITGERRHLAILFCVMVGSVVLAAQLDPGNGARRWRVIGMPRQGVRGSA